MWFFRAVAFDLDGTLAVADRVKAEVLSGVDAARRERAVLLVTGRVERDLDRVFPGLADHFDAVVTENGAVITRPGSRRVTKLLHEPVDRAVEQALALRGVGTDRGHVLLAIDGSDAGVAAEVIAELGLDHQVVHNRGSAMVLPAGTTKGNGLCAALKALGLSEHNTVAVGDAENDLTLLRTAELGVAVADAVPSLAAHADLVLELPDGDGVTALLESPVLSGRDPVWPARRRVTIGQCADGTPAWLPGAQASVLITGESGSGKSYLAGLLAERWIDAGYTVLVIDPEGDHLGLTERPDVLLIDASTELLTPHDLVGLLAPPRASVVLDLSSLDQDAQLAYVERLPREIASMRSRHGVPHWVIYDEAHQQAWMEQSDPIADGVGSCLVTWRPQLLEDTTVRRADVVIHVGQADGLIPDPDRLASPHATLSMRGTSASFVVGERHSTHVRHQHKYATAPLPPSRRFYFHGEDSTDPSAAAATLGEFRERLSHADAATVAYHVSRGDFSKWVGSTLADHTLSEELAHIERDLATRQAAAVEVARQQILHAVQRRYLQS